MTKGFWTATTAAAAVLIAASPAGSATVSGGSATVSGGPAAGVAKTKKCPRGKKLVTTYTKRGNRRIKRQRCVRPRKRSTVLVGYDYTGKTYAGRSITISTTIERGKPYSTAVRVEIDSRCPSGADLVDTVFPVVGTVKGSQATGT